MDTKTKRSEIFTVDEKDAPITPATLVDKLRKVVENDWTGQATPKQRDEMVAIDFNNNFLTQRRTAAQRRQCWKNSKANTKKNAMGARQSRFQTGGGPETSPLKPLENQDLAVVSELCASLQNVSNSDTALVTATSSVSQLQDDVKTVQESALLEVSAQEVTTKKRSISRNTAASDAFSAYYSEKKRKLSREIEIMEEEAVLRKQCLLKDLLIKDLQLKQLQAAMTSQVLQADVPEHLQL